MRADKNGTSHRASHRPVGHLQIMIYTLKFMNEWAAPQQVILWQLIGILEHLETTDRWMWFPINQLTVAIAYRGSAIRYQAWGSKRATIGGIVHRQLPIMASQKQLNQTLFEQQMSFIKAQTERARPKSGPKAQPGKATPIGTTTTTTVAARQAGRQAGTTKL